MKNVNKMAPKPPGKRKSLFDNMVFLRVIAIVIACICWIAVAMAGITDYRGIIGDVPVNVALQADTLAMIDLNIIEVSHDYVSVGIEGPRSVVGNLRPADLVATVQIPVGLVESGVYDLVLVLANPAQDFQIINYTPRQVRVTIDRLETSVFEIEPEVAGFSSPPGFIIEEPLVSPANITVTGPHEEISRVSRAVIRMELEEELDRTFNAELPIVLLDEHGEEILLDSRHLTLNQEYAQLWIPILREKELPLEIRFLSAGIPDSFPIYELQYTMSNYEVMVAGPVDTVARYQEILLGFIDLRTLTPTTNIFTFDVDMPTASVINLDNIFTVTVNFHASGWDEAFFTVENIEFLNIPSRYDVELLTDTIPGVHMVGGAAEIEELSADDIIATIDLSERVISPGQFRLPVRISAPTRGFVWAAGEYSVVVQISERE